MQRKALMPGARRWRALRTSNRSMHSVTPAHLTCPPRYLAWRKLIKTVRSLPEREMLHRLNAGINALIGHGEDSDVFNRQRPLGITHGVPANRWRLRGLHDPEIRQPARTWFFESPASHRRCAGYAAQDRSRRAGGSGIPSGVLVLDNLTDEPYCASADAALSTDLFGQPFRSLGAYRNTADLDAVRTKIETSSLARG